MAGAVKEAGGAALVAFGLFVLIIGVRTDQSISGGGALVLTTRFGAVAALVAAVFAGSLLGALLARRPPIAVARYLPERAIAIGEKITGSAASTLLVFALVLPVLFYS